MYSEIELDEPVGYPINLVDPTGNFAIWGAAIGGAIQAAFEAKDLYSSYQAGTLSNSQVGWAAARVGIASAAGAVGVMGGQALGEIAAGAKLIDYGAHSFSAAAKVAAPMLDMGLGYAQNGLNNLTMGKDFNDGGLRAVGVSLIGHGAGLYAGGKMSEIGMGAALSEHGAGGFNLLSNIDLGYRSSSTIFSHEAAGLGAATGVGTVNGLLDLNSSK